MAGDGTSTGPSKITVQVEPDHLDRLSNSRKPSAALGELVWNALDADADRVRIEVDRNLLGGIEAIRVADNGRGMAQADVSDYFGRLGGSWKKLKVRTPAGRVLHGKQGEGRFRAFALGGHVEWLSRHRADDGAESEIIVRGRSSSLEFELVSVDTTSRMLPTCGTTVTVRNVRPKLAGLADGPSQGLVEELTEQFALYLMQYPGISVVIGDQTIEPLGAMIEATDLDLVVEVPGGGTVAPKLTIIEWKKRTVDRGLYLCDEDGFALLDLKAPTRLPGFAFTAYVRSPIIRELAQTNELAAEEAHPVVAAIANAARDQVREHFRTKRAIEAHSRVEAWKTDKVYPFQGAAASKIEEVERQVFDVCASSVEMLAPEFEKADAKTKALTFRLLRQAIEKSPAEVQKILGDVLDLPKQKQQQLAKLLDRTSLSAIINASSVIADRLEFLHGLDAILFDPETKGLLKERRGLHKMLEENTWIFGEEFHLTVSDKGLTKCLMRHLELAGKNAKRVKPVKTSTGQPQIVDLFLSRRVPLPNEHRQHLIVELKRPNVEIDSTVLAQVKKYAASIAKDERFRNSSVTWSFWAVSNTMDELAREEASQADRAPGIVLRRDGDIPYTIWAKTWGQLLDECRGRLEFFRRKLEYQADDETGKRHLREVYEKWLPTLGGVGSGDIAVAAASETPSASGDLEAAEGEFGGSFGIESDEDSDEEGAGWQAVPTSLK